ncbi:putative invertase inhibitor [Manihot esculenta]|uniref:Pectinesterase inhibitor domain-containing protein n=1 Tax=Manihot esculenta TaxID=3983 RepID=A0A2C9UH18_MANES|nr:putative invertase inhibitor [Manihot esculenta]OAY29782.1 hypothetical protein MANES_15G171900v8 [Manihot esculenta]
MKIFFKLSMLFLFFNYSLSLNHRNPTNYFCKKAAESDPILSYKFCVESLESNPKTQNATLEDLLHISIALTKSNSTTIISSISKLLKQQNLDSYTREALEDCLELYCDAKSELNEAMWDLKKKDYFKANIDVSSAMDSSSTCENGFNEKKGIVSPLSKENYVFFQLTAIVLAFINMLS